MTPEAPTQERYASQVGALWCSVSHSLVRLEALAGSPELLDDDTLDELRGHQYRLHVATEHTFGLAPPAGAERAHQELAAALGGARDATGEVVDAIESGKIDAVDAMVHEWRGALFRVRLARHRLVAPRKPARPVVEDRPALCDFHSVAEVRRGDLLLTVSTGGASPGLAARVRARLASEYGPEWAGRLELLRERRAAWRRDGRNAAELTDALLQANGWLA